jgi:eukaryotic-like serine/threonine-protein kinase
MSHEPLPQPPSPPVLAPGDVLGSRFRIVRFVGQGGMGEVYEALHLDLHEQVALKVLRRDIAGDPRAMERFRREIHLARRVTHPHVCRIFDLERHATATGEITVLTMELLQGQTLEERLRTRGRMSTQEALPVVAQVADALAAAHRAGVVHRDFKPANVMLVPAPETPEGLRAVVTDFGMARAADEGKSVLATAESGLVPGTAAYMAPEQAEGREATPASDIYSLGVVMYEMVTGQRPHTGSTAVSMLLRRLREPAPTPRVHVPELDPRWTAAILRCLERDPADRFTAAIEVVKALRGEDVRRRRRPFLALLGPWGGHVLVALTAALVALALWRVLHGSAGLP